MKKLLLMAALSACVATSGFAQVANHETHQLTQGIIAVPNQSTVFRAASGLWEAAEEYAGGTGTEADPYQIATPEQFAKFVEDGQATSTDESQQIMKGVYFKQTADIDLSANYMSAAIGNNAYFAGVYDGNGYTIKGYKFYGIFPEIQGVPIGVGMFNNVKGATIKDITMEDVEINISFQNPSQCTSNNGILAANVTSSIIENCHVSGSITINANGAANRVNVGGIVGEIFDNTIINNCSTLGTIEVTHAYAQDNAATDWSHTAGIAAYAEDGSTIVNCSNEMDIITTGTGSSRIGIYIYSGGILAEGFNAQILNCSNEGSIAAKATNTDGNPTHVEVGGIVGEIVNGAIRNCWVAAQLTKEGGDEGIPAFGIVYTAKNVDRENNYVSRGFSGVAWEQYDTSLETDYMQSEAFVADLNANLPVNGMEWNYREGDYPTLRTEGTTANELIQAPRTTTIRTVVGGVGITTEEVASVSVYTFYGVQKVTKTVPAGQTTISLEPGLYVLKVNNEVYKISVH